MFLVSDNRSNREKKIRAFLVKKGEYPIAVILSAIHFEWTLRRAIIILGKLPTAQLKKIVQGTSGINNYKDLWNKQICDNLTIDLPSIIKKWGCLHKAYKRRSILVHGDQGGITNADATQCVDCFMTAAKCIDQYVTSLNLDIYSKLQPRNRLRKKI